MTLAEGTDVWSGSWVGERLGVRLRTTSAPLGVPLESLVGLAVRRNPRRAHLLVSRVLGKHVPTDPRLVHGAGLLLGELVRRALARGPIIDLTDHPVIGIGMVTHRASVIGAVTHSANEIGAMTHSANPDPDAAMRGLGARLAAALADPDNAAGMPDAVRAAQPTDPDDYPAAVVLGYAETATALGGSVADALRTAPYLHSTRRRVPAAPPLGGFEEEHSHATSHLLLPDDAALLLNDLPLVLVDDELSTGTTVLNTISELHALAPRGRYVVASLVDLRTPADRARMAAAAVHLGARIDVVALAAGEVELPPNILDRGRELVAATEALDAVPDPGEAGSVRRVDAGWPAGLPEGGRHGFRPADRAGLDAAVRRLADRIATGPRLLVLGSEELMYAPLRLAESLADARPECDVRYSTTTRSPVLAVDDPGYAIRTRLDFPSHDAPHEGPGPRFAYNVGRSFDTVVLVIDEAGDTPELHASGGLLDALTGCAGDVVLVVLPCTPPRLLPEPLRGPAFGSYAADEVAWLLKDLSRVALEAPTEEREEAVQAGAAHYAESLPVEYQPSAEYQQFFHDALESGAGRLAHAVGVVTELVLQARGRGAVLVSLARAGTPIGILMRRWAQQVHGLDLPHYAVSIVRGRGIDPVALAYLARHHDPASVMFVDGWTGKGAITRELAAALREYAAATGVVFGAEMAVLADPGSCVELFGTREDYLIPSACLNSTVSGLVSRTVLNDALIGPDDFHGAKFYANLAGSDVSNTFLDAVTARFGDVRYDVARDWPLLAATDRRPQWSGWAAIERICAEYGIGQVNLVKPGVGETTRVLLRRVPWKVLVRAGAEAELGHVRMLAASRGVPVETVTDLPYSCVGIIHPQFTRGAVGADGTGVRGEVDALEAGPGDAGHGVDLGDLVALVAARAREAGLPERLSDEVARYAPSVAPGSGRALVACDLDRTLVYSARAMGLVGPDAQAPRLVVAEVYRGEPLSFWTRDAEQMVTALAVVASLVPTTTRTRAQYERIHLPRTPQYAITSNGGHILVDGVPDADWSAQVAASLTAGCAPLDEVVAHLTAVTDPLWLINRRVAEDLFAYLVVDREAMPVSFVKDLEVWSTQRGWTVSVQGRKVYCVPGPLTKSSAMAEIAARLGAVRTLAAGDSLLDADLLTAADEAIRPAHGELHDVGWTAPHLRVTSGSGVLAGQEIAARLLASVLAG